MKRLFSLTTLLLCSLVALAQTFTADGIKYKITSSDNLTVEVTNNNYSGNIVIPKKVYNSNSWKWFSVTSIGKYAFEDCSGLTDITIPNSVTNIGEHAFLNCESLTSIEIPNSVTSIGNYAFCGCSGLTTLEFPNSVTSIGNFSFDRCSGLTAVTIPKSVTSIGYGPFIECNNLKTILVDAENTTYDSRNGCNAIIRTADNTLIAGCSATVIPNSVTSIGNTAFYWCTGLTSIKIPNSVTSIGNTAFSYCSDLTSIEIPNSVTSIGSGVFRNCTGLTSIEIPNSVTSIGNEAFDGCTGLTSIEIPNSMTSIGNGTFSGCRGLTSVTIPNSVTSIGNSAFYCCTGLTSVRIPNSVTSIGNSAFSSCSGLTAIDIPSSVTSIGGDAFAGCSGLTSFVFPNSVTIIGNIKFGGCSSLTTIKIPSSVTSIEYSAFAGCSSLVSIEIPNSVTSIGDYAFRDCSSLTSIEIPNSVPSIGYMAFSGCSSLTSVVIPNSVTSIGHLAFSGCSTLTSVVIPNSVTSIGDSAFDGCTGLTSITIPSSVTNIGLGLFAGCRSLQSITVDSNNPTYDSRNGCNAIIGTAGNALIAGCPKTVIDNSVTVIVAGAFAVFDNITSIEIPNTVTSIHPKAFYGCTGLSKIYSHIETPFAINDNVFWSNNNGTDDTTTLYETIKLYVPKGKVDAYMATDGWKNFKNILEMADANPITITADNKTIEYGEALPEFTFKSEGGELSGTPTITCEATSTSPSGNYPITVSKGTVENLHVTYVAGTLTINMAPLTVTAKSYTIKQGDPFPTFETTITGFKNSETSSVLTTQPTFSCSATSASAPGAYDIEVSGGAATNYSFTYMKGTLTITDADPVTVTATSYSITYGDALPEYGYTSEGAILVGIPSISCSATTTSPVGTYPITISKGRVTNYNDTYVNGTLTINKATLTVAAKSYTIKQGEALPSFEATYTGFKNSETSSVLTTQPTFTCSATSASAPGTYDIDVGGGAATNYNFTYTKGTLTITDADPVTVTATSYSITYGDALPEYGYTSEGATLVGIPSISCSATTTSPVGTYPITVSKGSVTNYNNTYVNGTLTITKAPLTIKAGTYTRKRGKDNPEFTLSYQGFKNNETKDVLSTPPSVTTSATENSPIGTYAVIVSGAEASNYEITHVNGTLIVERLMGDANGDGDVTEADVNAIANHIMGQAPDNFDEDAADVNGDNVVNAADIVELITRISNQQKD